MTDHLLPPIHMAKVYLHQAQATKWRHWKVWLIEAAGKQRRSQLDIWREANKKAIPIIEREINQHGQWSLF
jgi:hypothetical protein